MSVNRLRKSTRTFLACMFASVVFTMPTPSYAVGQACPDMLSSSSDNSFCVGDGMNFSHQMTFQAKYFGSSFTAANLSFTSILSSNFMMANLKQADFSIATLYMSNFNSVIADHSNFRSANLVRTSFVGANLSNSNLSRAVLSQANFSGADLSSSDLSNAYLTETNLSGAILRGVLSGGILGKPSALPSGWCLASGYLVGPGVDIHNVDFGIASFENADLGQTNIDGADLSQVTLTNVRSGGITGTPAALPPDWTLIDGYLIGPTADLSDAQLSNSFLQRVNLREAKLTGADFTGAQFLGIMSGGITGIPKALPSHWSVIGGYLVGPTANLNNADLRNANLENVYLSSATLRNADLSNVNFYLSDLNQADLSGAKLESANFRSATLLRVALTGARVEGADFSSAILDDVSDNRVDWSFARCRDGKYGSTHLAKSCLRPALVRATTTIVPSISGPAKVNLKKVNSVGTFGGTWIGVPLPTKSYQWYICKVAVPTATGLIPRNCSKIANATSKSLKVLPAYKGNFLTVAVTGKSVGTAVTVILAKSTAKVS